MAYGRYEGEKGNERITLRQNLAKKFVMTGVGCVIFVFGINVSECLLIDVVPMYISVAVLSTHTVYYLT
jgi:hypothetical protein